MLLWYTGVTLILMAYALSDGQSRAGFLTWRGAGLLVVAGALCGALWWRWRHTQQGWLTWAPVLADASQLHLQAQTIDSGWWWSSADGVNTQSIGAPVVVWDMGSRMGLRVPAPMPTASVFWWRRGPPGSTSVNWLWVDRAMHPDRWLALRRALWAARDA